MVVETLTGEVPFVRGTDAAVMYAHVVEEPPSVSARRPELPAALDEVIAAGMAKDPDDRPSDGSRAAHRHAARAGPARPGPPGRGRLGFSRCRTPTRAPPAPGTVFSGRYEIVAPISSGAMGAVYRAIDRESGGEVAVKRLLDVRHSARFEIEARLLASLSHPRVVKVLDHSQDEQGLYIVMELVRGTDLGAQLKERGEPGLPFDEAIDWIRHTCEALQYVHDQQIVHRDVKPQNMILADNGVVLVDFGVARAIGSDETVGTIAVGTPRYMAPEVFAGGTVSPASDVFSLAATLWTLTVGAPPRYGDVMKIEKVAPGLPPELAEALQGGLEMLPEMRIPSAVAFAEAVGVPLTERGGESLAQSLGRAPVHRRVIEAIVRTAAGMFEAAACSIALVDQASGELVYEAAWGAGASEVVGMRLPPGAGLAGLGRGQRRGRRRARSAARTRAGQAQVAAKTGYVPVHDARHAADQGRQDDRRAVAARPPRRRPVPARGPRARRAVRRSRGRGARPRHLPAVHDRRAHLAAGLVSARLRLAQHDGQPLRRDRRRLGLWRVGDGLPAGRGGEARPRPRARQRVPAGLVHAQPVQGARELLESRIAACSGCTTTGPSRGSTRWCPPASAAAR